MHERAIRVPARESLLRVAAEKLPDPARGCPARYVCEVRLVLVLHSLAEELLRKSPPGCGRVLEVGVESLERARAQAQYERSAPRCARPCVGRLRRCLRSCNAPPYDACRDRSRAAAGACSRRIRCPQTL